MEDFDDPVETWTVRIDADASNLRNELRDATNMGRQFSSALIGAFRGIAVQGKSLGDVLKGLALRLSEIVLKAAFKPLERGISNAFAGLFSGGFGFTNGGTLSQGTPVPFANGGVIRSPVTFPLAGGQVGIAGERGAEAIMPLSRGPDGRLGVAAPQGMGTTIQFNVNTPDADSFRRSESQIAAMLARTVAAGQRNL